MASLIGICEVKGRRRRARNWGKGSSQTALNFLESQLVPTASLFAVYCEIKESREGKKIGNVGKCLDISIWSPNFSFLNHGVILLGRNRISAVLKCAANGQLFLICKKTQHYILW